MFVGGSGDWNACVDRNSGLTECKDRGHWYVTGLMTERRLLRVLVLQGVMRGGSGE
jgi:hypothetical protein